jgi:hypothetical protein
MSEQTFQYNGATITVRHSTGRDAIDSPLILFDLHSKFKEMHDIKENDKVSKFEVNRMGWFSNILLRSKVEGELPFEWPELATIDDEQIYSAYMGLMDGPIELVEQWRTASKNSNKEIYDPEG